MNRKNSAGKNYILQAKKRLLNDEYSYINKENDENLFLNNKKITRDEMTELNSIVEGIMASDEFVYDPLSQLIIDEQEFAGLSETLKEKYLFELSDLYIYIKNKNF